MVYNGIEYDDDIPEQVAYLADGAALEYCGIYKGWDAYHLGLSNFKNPFMPELDGAPFFTGYPQYILIARDGSGKCKRFSDDDFVVTIATWDQLQRLRRQGHKKRS